MSFKCLVSLPAGPLPRKESDTKVSFTLGDSTVETEWSASATHDPSEHTVSVTISSSPDAPIGVYSLTVDQEGLKTTLGQFTLLFNAWCPSQYISLDIYQPSAFWRKLGNVAVSLV